MIEIHDGHFHFSEITNIPLVNEEGIRLGKIKDYFVNYEEVYPSVLAIQYKKNGQFFYLNWEHVKTFSRKKVVVKNEAPVGRSRTYPKINTPKIVTGLLAEQFADPMVEYPAIGKIILDKQIVDTSGKKVVRVNDIQFIQVGHNLRVVHAAVGLKSMIRRLGFEKIISVLQKITTLRPKFLDHETVINWKYVLAVPDQSVQQHVRLSLSLEDFKGLHPADLADILEDLSNKGREAIFRELDPELAAETLSEIDPDMQINLLKNEDPSSAAEIIENMSPEDAADILNEMNDDRADAILAEIDDTDFHDEIKYLLDYEEESAGGLMTPNFFSFNSKLTKEESLQLIRNNPDEAHHNGDIFITDDNGKLIGICSFLDLLITSENLALEQIMHKDDIKSVAPSEHYGEVIDIMNKYNLVNIPVIDQEEKLLGVVFIDELLPWILNEK